MKSLSLAISLLIIMGLSVMADSSSTGGETSQSLIHEGENQQVLVETLIIDDCDS